ncbi:DUF1704 domain-containing protein [Candidatus Peribacteria bacterium]|nr:DUF1704 domain-containing protein [Candidatus Peribacteria bacterium]
MFFPFRNHGVLGLNARSLLYIKPFNPKKAVAFADDKMKTKAFLSARGIPTAKLFARIDTRRQLNNFDFSTLPDECVLKPNEGFGGEGIIILKGRKNGEFLEQGKIPITKRRLTEHIEDILDGKFSVTGTQDSAFFEKILVADDSFSPFRPAGLPDLRIIVFNLVPVMAMLRIPTAESRGKANVHLGGIGVGIDIAKGITTHAAQHRSMVSELTHGGSVSGIQIPRWEELLLIASKIQYLTNIGYLAVDLTLDRDMGPVLLEVNARAGLMVQVANLAPLRSRLERVEGLSVNTPEKGVRLAQELFGASGQKPEEKKQTEQRILALRETIELNGEGVQIEEPCSITPEVPSTIFTREFLLELASVKAAQPIAGSSNTYKVKFALGGRRLQTVATVGIPEDATLRVSIGSRDLRGFLIDPSRKAKSPVQIGVRKDLRAVDRILCGIDRELSTLKYLRPLNLTEERAKLRRDLSYEPIFLLRECKLDLGDLERTLLPMEGDESTIGILLRKKRRELLLKIELVRSRGNAEKFVSASLSLFGAPSPALIGFAKEYLRDELRQLPEEEKIHSKTAEEARPVFEEHLERYGLHDWIVEVKRGMVADCAVGEHRVFLRSGALFTDDHLRALLAHEIETHVLTAENGRMQPYEIFRRGCANYLDTQEGLAIYSQNRVLPLQHEKRFLHAKGVLAVAFAMDHSFAETRSYLENDLGYTYEKAISKTIDLKRGFSRTQDTGAFTKSLVYFRGFRAIDQFVSQGGDLRKLFVGKIAIEDLPLIEKIEGMRPPGMLPVFLRAPVLASPKPKRTRKSAQKGT